MQTSLGNDFELKRKSVSGLKIKPHSKKKKKKCSSLKMTCNLGVLKILSL